MDRLPGKISIGQRKNVKSLSRLEIIQYRRPFRISHRLEWLVSTAPPEKERQYGDFLPLVKQRDRASRNAILCWLDISSSLNLVKKKRGI